MPNPVRPSDRPPVPGAHAHFRVSRSSPPGTDTRHGPGAGPAAARGQAAADTAQQTADRELVLAALRTLPAEHRQVLLECYYRGASAAQAAETLGVPLGTVKSRAYDALRALRQQIGMNHHADQ
jgi:RNA polymerase sigma factor (sigma-70 family)